MAMGSLYNYFSDYEIPFADGMIKKALFIRAAQDGYLPHVYNAQIIKILFEDDEDMDFLEFAISVKALRLYLDDYGMAPSQDTFQQSARYNPVSMSKEKFMLAYKKLPTVFQYLMESSYVPSVQEIETAATNLRGKPSGGEDSFLKGYNNLIFLQKGKKMLKKTAKKKNPTADQIENVRTIEYANGAELFFNMMN